MDRLTGSDPPEKAIARGRRIHPDAISGSVLVVIALVYAGSAWRIPAGDGEPGPGFLPLALSILLAGVSLTVLRHGLVSAVHESEPAPAAGARGRPLLAALATVAYAALFQPLGFAVSTVAYSAAVTRVFTRDLRMILTVPIGVTIALFAFFRLALGVRLPPFPFG